MTFVQYLVISAFALAGYLIGSLNAGVIVSKAFYGKDVREFGSGNAGTTNMLRTFGKKAAALTLVLDFLKGIVSCLIPCLIVYVACRDHFLGLYSMLAAALGCVAGHNWPVYFGFKGGKGVLVSFSVMLFLAPVPALIALGVFIIVVLITRYVSLGSVLAALAFPVPVWFLGGWAENTKGLTVFFFVCIILVLLLIVRHRSNLVRLFTGKESKLSFKNAGKKNEEADGKDGKNS
ncbi:MAG: glycerol-3-phosphate 1-O-acyltransferase PlsY [Clostridia bacterium]|nr:glycerol-3-phosphate 1-O-acyltransferase PlsY [Clostridia bacterium]